MRNGRRSGTTRFSTPIIEEKLEIEREDVEVIENEPHGEGKVLELEFVQPARTETGSLYAIGVIAGGYASLIDTGYDTELLEATVLDESQQSFATFHVLIEWAEEYNEGIITARGYGNKPWMSTKSGWFLSIYTRLGIVQRQVKN